MAETVFILCLVLALYPYLFFPLLLLAWGRLAGRSPVRGTNLPRVSMIVSVYNEERVIAEKIANALALDYPEELLEILVVSDGSTDRTEAVVAAIEDPRVALRAFPGRNGKTACLNRVAPEARGEILLFTDANSMFPPNLVRRIVGNFSDSQIGLVTGWTKYRQADGGEETTGLYSRLERLIKEAESDISSCVGADGAVFAMRRELYLPLRDDDINDFVIPLNVIGAGKRVILDPEVFCIEQPSAGELREFRRQVRITTRTLGAIGRNSRYLNPFRYGSFAFFLLSHKIIRFLVPFFFLGVFSSLLLLAGTSTVFAALAVAQVLFVIVGLTGMFRYVGGRLVQLCSFILLTISAQFVGWIRWATGKSDVVWKPER